LELSLRDFLVGCCGALGGFNISRLSFSLPLSAECHQLNIWAAQSAPILVLSPHMRAAVILGLGCSPKQLKTFQSERNFERNIEWRMGMPSSSDDADVILVFGGDGTVHRHLGQLVRLGLPVLVVPAGSGNDFARALGLRRVRDSLAAWRRFCGSAGGARPDGVRADPVRTIDLGLITPLESSDGAAGADGSRYFCCVAGVGLDGEVSRRANRLPRWLRGHGGYVVSLVPAIFSFAPLRVKVLTAADNKESDRTGESWIAHSDRPTILAAFANTPVYGGGMEIAPRAKMDDGLLDVCIVGGVDPFKLFCMFPTVYSGRHLGISEVEYFQAGRVRVETEYPLDVYADGEYVCRTPVEVGVHGAVLRVVVT
jgi:diacylglycerol kinase (ATP)